MKPAYTLAIAFGVPLTLIGLVALSTTVLQSRVEPAYDVLYTDSYLGSSYFVDAQHLVAPEYDASASNQYVIEQARTTRFYRYDPVADTSVVVGDFEAAKELEIVSIDRSPDGYRVAGTEHEGGFLFPFFYPSDGNRFVIEGNGGRKGVSLMGNTYSTHIIGWVTK
ncbi:MAG TPA: hypothetical protein VGB97_03150 [Candidatus Paceibacterota bacterium]|jgi:hypothetical protein